MAEAANPFASLLPTPEGLDMQRRNQFLALSEGQDYWSRVAGLTGLDFRRELNQRTQGLTPEDRRAFNTQAILTRAQKSLADRVKSGEVDPLSAQAEVIRQAMSDFMGAGDYQAAQSLIPSLNQIMTYQNELEVLKSETGRNQASAYSSTASGDKSYSDIAIDQAKLPGEIEAKAASTDLDRERINTERARQARELAAARASDRAPAGGSQKAPTGENLSAEGFRARMITVEDTLASLGYKVSGFRGYKEYEAATTAYTSPNSAIVSGANTMLSPEAQQYYQAAADWIRAKLRKESGATISASEWDQEMKTYFPIPGDSPAVVAQKKKAREQATRSMGIMAGPALGLGTPDNQWSVVK